MVTVEGMLEIPLSSITESENFIEVFINVFGAVNDGVTVSKPFKIIEGPSTWLHEYLIILFNLYSLDKTLALVFYGQAFHSYKVKELFQPLLILLSCHWRFERI